MSRRGHAWRQGSPDALFTKTTGRTSRPTYLPECPRGSVRVAVFTQDGKVSQVRHIELIDGKAVVPLLGQRLTAEPMEPHPDAPGCRLKVTMPKEEEP